MIVSVAHFAMSSYWRANQAALVNERYLNLLDSQVNLAHAAKGRGSSHRMRHVELKTNAFILLGHLREVNGYTRSDKNPADFGSRDVRGWFHHRKSSSSASRDSVCRSRKPKSPKTRPSQ